MELCTSECVNKFLVKLIRREGNSSCIIILDRRNTKVFIYLISHTQTPDPSTLFQFKELSKNNKYIYYDKAM